MKNLVVYGVIINMVVVAIFASIFFNIQEQVVANIDVAPIQVQIEDTRPVKKPENLKAVVCLADNIFHEARGESVRGQEMVAQTTLNRVSSSRWPNNVCGVVYQKYQFSWTINNPGRNLDTVQKQRSYERAMNIAKRFIAHDPKITNADHYYAHRKVTPEWKERLTTVAVVGNHTFMR